jgi:tetratricopeptide (TPR) repeat protein
MTVRPKQSARQQATRPAARTDEFAPCPPSPADAVSMAEVERLLSDAESCSDAAGAVQSLRRAAVLLDGDGRGADPERAFLIMALAFRRAPADREVVEALDRLAERLGRWEALLACADEVMLELDEPTVLGQLWAHVARWSRRLERWDKAIEAGENAMALAPDDERGCHELAQVYRELGHHGSLARLLGGRARFLVGSRSPDSRAELLEIHLELAALYEEQLGDDEQAIAASERAFKLDPSNSAALVRLERLAEKQNRQMLLVDVLERRLACAPTMSDRTAVALRLAASWEAVGRTDNACRVLGQILAEGPGRGTEDAQVLRALARLYRSAGESVFLFQILERLLGTGPARDEARALAREMGELCARELDRPDEAERYLDPLLAEDPSDPGATRALATLLRKRCDWGRLGDILVRAGQHAPTSEARVGFLHEAVRVQADHLGDPASARLTLALILDADPTDREALDQLIADANQRQDWETMRALVGRALASASSLLPARAAELHTWLARAADGLSDKTAALAHQRQAVALCPDHPEYLRALAYALVDQDHLIESLPHLEWLWEHPPQEETDAERSELAYRRGCAWLAHGDRPSARTALQQALHLAPANPSPTFVTAAIEALGSLALDDGDVAAAVSHKEELLRTADDAPRRVALSIEIARLYQHDLRDRPRAARVLKDGLALVPGSHELLHALLDLHVEGRAWRGAVNTLLALAQGTAGAECAKYLATAARIAEDKLGVPDEAAALFERALDADPLAFEIFARLERSLTERRAFGAQADAYRTMLTRVEGHDEPQVALARRALWRGLGEIYRSRLRDTRSAITAFEAAAALDPGDGECRLIITELCELAGPDTWGRAVGDRRRLLGEAGNLDDMAAHLRALHRLGLRMNHLDQAFRAGEALIAMRLATPEEHRFCQRHALPPAPTSRPINDVRWHKLRHQDQDQRLSLAFAAVGRAQLVARGRAARAWGLRDESPSERQDSERSILARMITDLTLMLGAPQPQLRFRPDLPGTVDLAGVVARTEVVPTLVAGADMLQVRSRREILALVGKTATRLRWEHLVLWPTVVPNPVELQVAVLALRRLSGQPPLTPLRRSDERLVARYADSVRRLLTRDELERIAAVASELDPAGVGPWVRGAVLTTGRAGLLASGDLAVSLQLARAETYGPLTIRPFEQVRDLISYSVSDDHLSLRRELGLPTLDGSGPLSPSGGIGALGF